MNPQLTRVEQDRVEARGRSEQADILMRAVVDKGNMLSDQRRVVGRSSVWQPVLRRALRVAATDATVSLQGESGTGKEVVARFIHHTSPRKNGPFVAINCAALPETLLESELFGFERGAFTGAQQPKPGHIELANGGVLFLDEITELPLTAQAKLLRVLQERELCRLGGTRSIKVNARVITATNQDMRGAVAQGRFREDLYLSDQCLRHQNPSTARTRRGHPAARPAVPRGICAGRRSSAAIDAERGRNAACLPLAGQRPGTPECARAGGD